MRPTYSVLLSSSIVACASSVFAQTANDGSDLFLSAYSNFQKAEALEKKGDSAGALALYEEVSKSLGQLLAQYPNWNPQVVKLRTTYTAQAIQRLRSGGGATSGNKTKANTPSGGVVSPSPAPISTSAGDASPLIPKLPERAGVPVAPSDPFADIQARLTQLQNDLQFALDEAQRLRREKAELAAQLEEVTRGRAKAENMERILEQRSDVAEKALLQAKEENVKSVAEITVLERERDSLKQQKRELQAEHEASEELRRRLEGRLAQTQGREINSNSEKDATNQRLAEASKQVVQLQVDLEKAAKEKAGVQAKLEQTAGERDQAKTMAEAANKEREAEKIAKQEATKDKEKSEKAMLQAGMERDAAKAALAKVSQERDDAVALAAKLKDARSQIDRLELENQEAAGKLAKAQKQIEQRRQEGPQSGQSLKALREEVESVRTKLVDSQKKASDSERSVQELQGKLDSALKESSSLKTESTQLNAERDREHEEKEILQGILRRTLVEQGRRDGARKALVAEVSRLKIDSEVLVKQIGLLGEPILQLTEKEQALFKQPLVEISEEGISISAIKTTSKQSPKAQVANKGGKPAPEAAATSNPLPGPITAQSTGVTPVPVVPSQSDAKETKADAPAPVANPESVPDTGADAVRVKMSDAKERFEKGDFEGAEKVYQEALVLSPGNAFVLSNLGVAQFRAKHFAKAEESLKKALDLSPQDAFSRSTLGIVYYTQGKLDRAVEELTQSVAVNPNNAVAHNYLGIAASRKGWQENARKELETAAALDPKYADAFFNLAVVCASQKPADKEAARAAYKKATELGAATDPRLEELLR
ncbi:MAG: tetratricopeptide repeat protein [Verrucomicrobiota bacterium]